MITINFTINDNPYKVDFREHDNILDSACYEPQLPHDKALNGYVFELLTNGLYEGHAAVGDEYSMVLYRELESQQLSLTWRDMWNDNANKDDNSIGAGDYFNCKLVDTMRIDIISTIDDDLGKIDGVQQYKYGCDAGSMVISVEGFRVYFGNDYGDGEFPIYYAPEPKSIPHELKKDYRFITTFEIQDTDDKPMSAFIESYDCKFMGYEKELTINGRYAVSCNGGRMLIEYWGAI